MVNQNPEQKARDTIDVQLEKAGQCSDVSIVAAGVTSYNSLILRRS